MMPDHVFSNFDESPSRPDFDLARATIALPDHAPGRPRKTALSLALTALTVASVGWYWLSPIMALSAFREAVTMGDAADIAEMVDFPALREQLRTEMVSRTLTDSDRTIGSFVDLAFVDVSLSALSSPIGMQRFMGGSRLFDSKTQVLGQFKNWDIDRRGLSSFKAQNTVGSNMGPQLVFRRDGLGWRLVGIYAAGQSKDAGASAAVSLSTYDLDPATVDAVTAAEARAEADAVAQAAIEEAAAAASDNSASQPGADTETYDAASDAAAAAAAAARDVEANGNPVGGWQQ